MAAPLQTIDPNVLPPELMTAPQPLVCFFGLELANPVHKSVWDAFNTSKKLDRAALNFKLTSIGTEFPVAKPKIHTYEWYYPKGIIKRNWLNKHLNVVPAVAVLFEDLEWADPQWTEKQLQCASHVQSIKNSLQGRNTRLLVVLLQRGTESQVEELVSSERAANLTSCCDINAKTLFVIPVGDQHLVNHVQRLEACFYDHAQTYYSGMAKTVRSHQEQLTSSHQGLSVRHQFKLGVISELQQDQNTALKYFTKGYNYLEEIRIVDTNCMEIKTVAGFFNYKMCRLMFKLNFPRDAITQFKAHIEKYKSRTGFRELQFEHYSWLAAQNNAFAELFCDAVKCGLPALQTQHPGKYYYKAAEFIGKRREAWLECVALPISPDAPLSGQLHSEFFGVRAIVNGETGSETQVIRLLQEQERSFNHSMAVITLLGQAMAQYKLYKCLRFRKKLAVDMAEEYFKMGDYSKALTLYSLMLADYRGDKWYTIFTEILLKTLRAAYLSASAVDFVSCSVEALSSSISIAKPERVRILENLWKVLEGVAPTSPQQFVPELKAKWETRLSQGLKSPVTVDLDLLGDSILELRATFHSNSMKCDEVYKILLYVRNKTEVPLKVRKFTVVLSNSKVLFKLSSQQLQEFPSGAQLSSLALEPGKCYQVAFESNQAVAENVELQLSRAEIEMGSSNCVLLSQKNLAPAPVFKSNFLKRDPLELVPLFSSCYVKPTFHLSAQTRQPMQPMLVNEYFQIDTQLLNGYDICLQNVGISITVPPALRNRVFLTPDIGEGRLQKLSSHIQIDIGDLQMQSSSPLSFYIISLVEGSIELKKRIWYQADNIRTQPVVEQAILDSSPVSEKALKRLQSTHDIKIDELPTGVRKIKEDSIVIGCVEEFSFSARFYTLSRQALMRAYRDEDLVLRVNIDVKAHTDIRILDFFFISDHNISERSRKNVSKLRNRVYSQGSSLEDVLVLRPNRLSCDWLSKARFLNEQQQRAKTPEKPPPPDENSLVTKTVYNNAEDSLFQTNSSRNGFIQNLPSAEPSSRKLFGVYCVRWSRVSSPKEVNESKFVVNGVDVVEPPLNLYCHVEQRLYVKVPLALRVTLKNPTNRILHLLVTFSPSSSFMYSGHKFLNITIFSYSSHEMAFILYPLKAGWHQLPELQLEYVNSSQSSQTKAASITQELATAIAGTEPKKEPDVQQVELNNLVKRWMPKWVFINPPNMELS